MQNVAHWLAAEAMCRFSFAACSRAWRSSGRMAFLSAFSQRQSNQPDSLHIDHIAAATLLLEVIQGHADNGLLKLLRLQNGTEMFASIKKFLYVANKILNHM